MRCKLSVDLIQYHQPLAKTCPYLPSPSFEPKIANKNIRIDSYKAAHPRFLDLSHRSLEATAQLAQTLDAFCSDSNLLTVIDEEKIWFGDRDGNSPHRELRSYKQLELCIATHGVCILVCSIRSLETLFYLLE